MPKVRLVMSYGFCSKFHTLSTMQKFWKSVQIWQSYREFKGGNFFQTQCISSPNTIIWYGRGTVSEQGNACHQLSRDGYTASFRFQKIKSDTFSSASVTKRPTTQSCGCRCGRWTRWRASIASDMENVISVLLVLNKRVLCTIIYLFFPAVVTQSKWEKNTTFTQTISYCRSLSRSL